MTHARYSFDEPTSVYDKLHAFFDYKMQKLFDFIAGGDFNTIVPREDLLNKLMVMFDLQVANREEFVGDEH